MTLNNIENRTEFDKKPEQEKWEVEKKFTLTDPNFFDRLETTTATETIEQIYLSNPGEPYNLRVREIITADGTVRHTATMKADASIEQFGLSRFETPVDISPETYAFYQKTDAPRLNKRRVEPMNGVTIDWIQGYDQPIIEIEDLETNEDAQLFLQQYGDILIDQTGHPHVDNEWIAHQLSGTEQVPTPQLTVEEMADKIWGYRRYGISPIVVTIDGRSGSGKTTYAKQLQSLLRLGSDGESASSTVLSTDNYHRGRSWLESQNNGRPWQNWDASIVYDTRELAADIAALRGGETITNRFFSFDDQEPHFDGTIFPTDIIIVEGIHAGTKDLEGTRHFHFPVQTSLATSIGRDLSRLREGDRSNDTIGSTQQRLAYQLEYAEPAFQSIDRVSKKNLKLFRRRFGKKIVAISTQEATVQL